MMSEELQRKVQKYERMLATAREGVSIAVRPESPLGTIATESLEMADAYLADGRRFRSDGDQVNALAAFSYGHAWIDAAARAGVLELPDDASSFAV